MTPAITRDELAWLSDYDSTWLAHLIGTWENTPTDLQWLRRQAGYDKSIEQKWLKSRRHFVQSGLRRLSRDYSRLLRIHRIHLAGNELDSSAALLRSFGTEVSVKAQLVVYGLSAQVSPSRTRDLKTMIAGFSNLFELVVTAA